MSTSKPPTPSSNIFGFDKTNQIMILALTLCVIFIVLVAAVCFFRCRRDRSSYVLDPDLVMPIGGSLMMSETTTSPSNRHMSLPTTMTYSTRYGKPCQNAVFCPTGGFGNCGAMAL